MPPSPSKLADATRDVRQSFLNLQNMENLVQLIYNNGMCVQSKTIEHCCTSIASSVSVILDCSVQLVPDKEIFIAFIAASREFLLASGTQKTALLPALLDSCDVFGEQLHARVKLLSAEYALIPKRAQLTAAQLCDIELLYAYNMLLAEIDLLHELRRHIARSKAERDQLRTHVNAHRLVLFEQALVAPPVECTPVHSPADDAMCRVCCSTFTDKGDNERLVLLCCQRKQSICRQCFVTASYQASGEGIKSFARCPFCCTEFSLYGRDQQAPAVAVAVAPTVAAATTTAAAPTTTAVAADVTHKRRRVACDATGTTKGVIRARRNLQFDAAHSASQSN